MLCTSLPLTTTTAVCNPAYHMMNTNFQPSSLDKKNNSDRRSSTVSDSDADTTTTGTVIPPPMPSGVSLNERAVSLPTVVPPARHLPGEGRSVSFSDTVSFNFPVPAAPSALPGRIVSQATRRSSLESLNDLDLSFSSLSSFNEDFNKPSGNSSSSKSATGEDHPLLEPHQIFAAAAADSKPTAAPAAFNTCSGDDLRTLLHRACQQYPRKKAIVKAALKKDPSAVRRRAFIPGVPSSSKSNTKSGKGGVPAPPEPYQLPINIALAHKASVDVLDMLVKADASQLGQKDGIHGANSLCLALEKRPNDIAVLGMFLLSNPQLVRQSCDNNNNTPLHVACQRGSCLPIIRQLFQMYPAALCHRNDNGKTPVDILKQQAQVCNKAKTSLKFLQEKVTAAMCQQQQQQQQQKGRS